VGDFLAQTLLTFWEDEEGDFLAQNLRKVDEGDFLVQRCERRERRRKEREEEKGEFLGQTLRKAGESS
jgi:hypothetical protein